MERDIDITKIMKFFSVLICSFTLLLVIISLYLDRHSWDNLNHYCNKEEEKFEDCFLNRIYGSLTRKYEGLGKCICIKEETECFKIRELDINLTNRFWFIVYKTIY